MVIWRFGGQFQCALFSFFFSYSITLYQFMGNSQCYVGRWIFWWKVSIVTSLLYCWRWLRRETKKKWFLFVCLMSATENFLLYAFSVVLWSFFTLLPTRCFIKHCAPQVSGPKPEMIPHFFLLSVHQDCNLNFIGEEKRRRENKL